jgi:hypothetical protein
LKHLEQRLPVAALPKKPQSFAHRIAAAPTSDAGAPPACCVSAIARSLVVKEISMLTSWSSFVRAQLDLCWLLSSVPSETMSIVDADVPGSRLICGLLMTLPCSGSAK